MLTLPMQGKATNDDPEFGINYYSDLYLGYVDIGESSINSIEITCVNFTGAAYATVAAPFSISLDGENFTDSVNFNSPGTTLYIRFTPTEEGYTTEQLYLISPGNIGMYVIVSGDGLSCNHTIPYSFSFEDEQRYCWEVVDANNDGTTFLTNTGNSYAYYNYNFQNPADDWLISPEFQLNGNQIGQISYRVQSSSYPERFQVLALGSDTIPLSPIMEINNTANKSLYFDMAPLQGSYRIGIHCISDANMYRLIINNFSITNNSPQVILNPTSITFPATAPMSHSSAETGTVTSIGAAGTYVTLSVPAPFELSADGTTYSNVLSLERGSGNVETDTFYIRLSPTSYENDIVEHILIASYAGTQDSISVSGTVFNCENTIPYTYEFNDDRTACWTVVNVNNDNKTFQFSTNSSYVSYNYHSTHPADDWLISPLFEFDGSQYGYFKYMTSSSFRERFQVFALGADTLTLTPVVDTSSNYWTKQLLNLTVLNGAYKIGIHCISEPDMHFFRITDFNLLPIVPSVAFEVDSLSFHTTPMGGSSESQQLIVTTMGIPTPVTVTAPEHFEISADGTTFGPSVTFPATGEMMRIDTLTVRFAPTVTGIFASPLIVTAHGQMDTCILKGTSRDCNEVVSIPFEEGFEGDFNYCWTIFDQDSAGNCWKPEHSHAHGGVQCVGSHPTYLDYTAEYALDNWLVSQPIQLTDSAVLSFYLQSLSSTQHFSVYISTTGGNIEDFTTELYYNTELVPLNYTSAQFSIPLYEYTGQTVRIAFRHHNSTSTMYLDDITIATPQEHPTIHVSNHLLHFSTLGINEVRIKDVDVTGFGLTGNITATVPEPFSLSVDGVTYAQTVALPSEGGPLHIRFVPTASIYYTKQLTLSSPGADNVKIELDGSGIECYNTIPYTHLFNLRNSCWEVVNANGDNNFFDFQTATPSYAYIYSVYGGDDWLISPTLPLNGNQYGFFEYSYTDNIGKFQVYAFGADTVPLSDWVLVDNFWSPTVNKTFLFDLSNLSGPYRIGIHTIQDAHYSALYFSNFNVLNITSPILEFQTDTLEFGDQASNIGSNPTRTVVLSKIGINTPITLNATGAYEISLNGSDYSSSLTIPADNAGNVYDTVLVRLTPVSNTESDGMLTATAGDHSDSVFLRSNIIECLNAIPYAYSFDNAEYNKCWTVVNSNKDNKTFTFNTNYGHAQYFYSSTTAADDWLISPVFHLTGNQYGSFDYRSHSPYNTERFEVVAIGQSDTVQLVPTMEISNLYYQTLPFDLSGLNGDYQICIHCTSDADQYVFYVTNFKVEHLVPTLTASLEQMDFGTLIEHGFTEAQQLVVNGSGVFAPITVTAPEEYEVSLDGLTYGPSVTIPARSAGFTADTFYVRFNPTTAGAHDNLLIFSANTCADTVYLHGTSYFCEVPYPLPLIEDFEDALSPCWQVIDHDNDGFSWYPTTAVQNATGHEGSNAYISLAYSSYSQGIIQNNWLVTPMIVPSANTVLAYYAKGTEGIPLQYNVCVATQNTAEAFLAGEPFLSHTVEGDWEENAASLADYAGDTVYVAFQLHGLNANSLTIDDLIITDNLESPIVLMSSNQLDFGEVPVGKSDTQQVEISAFGLSSIIAATANAPYSLSSDGVNFSQLVMLPSSGGILYVRFTPTDDITYDNPLSIIAAGTPTQNIGLHGIGYDCLNTIPYSYQFNDEHIVCWSVINANGDNKTFQFDTLQSRVRYSYNSHNAADDWLISPSFLFNGNQIGHFDYHCMLSSYPERFEVYALGTDTLLLSAPIEVTNSTPQTLNLDLTGLTGHYAIGIHCISDADRYHFFIEDFNILNIEPSFTVSEDSLFFALTPVNGHSASHELVVNSIGMTTPVTVTVPAPFEVSADNSSFGSTMTIPGHSTVFAHDTFYVRYSPTAIGPSQNNLTLSGGILQQTVVLTGSARDCEAVVSLPFYESFEGDATYCWTSVDNDGDGLSWYMENHYHAHTGNQNYISASFTSENGALQPDNWLISQPIQLPELPAQLSFWVRQTLNNPVNEYYSVYVSTTGNAVADFTSEIHSGYCSASYAQQSVSLRDYAGQTVWLAFRHHNSYNIFQLILDDIAIQLDTTPQLPMVVTDSVFSISQMSAVCIGQTVFNGNANLTACGFCWSTSPNPTTADNVANSTPSVGTMVGMLTGLSEHTTYYVRAFATNSIGTEYGEEIMFTTLCGPATQTSFSQTACESFSWNNSTYFESGDYTQSFTNMIGCDSIVTLHLTILHGTHNAVTETACDSFEWHNVNYTQSGTYTYDYTNADGCLSTDTLHLTILQSSQTEVQETVCESYIWNGVTYSETGDYTQTFTNMAGCDSVVTLHLTVHHGTHNAVTENACESYEWHGETYSETGTYTYAYTNADGCASVDTLHLTVHHGTHNTVFDSACVSYEWHGNNFTTTGAYTYAYTNTDGCASVDTLFLTVYPADTTEFTDEACDAYTWNGSTYAQSGDYTQTFTNLHGCDSVVILHLTLHHAVSSEETVSWPDSCYSWNSEEYCASGDYTQTLTTAHGCDSVVTLHLTITVGLEDFILDNGLRVYPNPTTGMLNISGTTFTDIQLFDAYGKLLGSWNTNGETVQIDLSRQAAGVYFIKALNQNRIVGVKKVLKRE